jgi:indole-3-glycerol phosphate synthase/phosphoribosylanthranilate isomerase
LHGVDAVVLPSRGVPESTLSDLVAVAHSLHMAVVTEVTSADDTSVAVQIAHGIIGLRGAGASADAGKARLRSWLREVPDDRTVVVLDEVASTEALENLVGVCDAAIVPASLCSSEPGCAVLQRLAGR